MELTLALPPPTCQISKDLLELGITKRPAVDGVLSEILHVEFEEPDLDELVDQILESN